MYKAQKGFTLIELVVVITILGILAAFAFPRFAALEIEARKATIDGLAGSLRSASALAHSLYLATGGAAVVMEGNTITMDDEYPDAVALGIVDTLSDLSGFSNPPTYVVGPPKTARFDKLGATTPANCSVLYTEAVGTTPPVFTVDKSDC